MITPPVTIMTHGIVAVAAAAGAWVWQANSYEAKLAAVQTEYAQAQHRAVEIAHADTIRLQKKADDAQANAAVRMRATAADAAVLRGTLDGLRDDLSAARTAMPDASCTSLRLHAATLNAVFGECSVEVERLAGQADGHAIDALKLLESWPAAIESHP